MWTLVDVQTNTGGRRALSPCTRSIQSRHFVGFIAEDPSAFSPFAMPHRPQKDQIRPRGNVSEHRDRPVSSETSAPGAGGSGAVGADIAALRQGGCGTDVDGRVVGDLRGWRR